MPVERKGLGVRATEHISPCAAQIPIAEFLPYLMLLPICLPVGLCRGTFVAEFGGEYITYAEMLSRQEQCARRNPVCVVYTRPLTDGSQEPRERLCELHRNDHGAPNGDSSGERFHRHS